MDLDPIQTRVRPVGMPGRASRIAAWIATLLGAAFLSLPGSAPPPRPGVTVGLPPPLPETTGQTVILAVGKASRISGNLDVTLMEVAKKRLPDRTESYKADLRVKRSTLAEDIILMSHGGWEYAQGAEFSLKDAVPGRTATLLVRPVEPALVPLPLAGDTLYLAKVGEAGRPLDGEHPGRAEFSSALAEAARRGPGERRWLLYVLIPFALKGTTLSWTDGAEDRALPAPRLIHRMPNSAACTFLIIDPDSPGTLKAKGPKGDAAAFTLTDARILGKSPVHRPRIRGGFPIENLPAGID